MNHNGKHGRPWWPWEEKALRILYPILPMADLLRVFARSAKAIASRAKLLGVKRGNRRPWTARQDRLLRELYPNHPTDEVAGRCGHSLLATYGRAKLLGVKKAAAYMQALDVEEGRRLAAFGRSHRFHKGQCPPNKGLRRPGYAPGRMGETQFKKGQPSRNYLPIGTVRTDTNGYLRRKIADGIGGFGNATVWEFVHKRVWTDAHGTIPAGHRIWSKDGNHANCALVNLELLSAEEHMARTTIHNLPPELKQVIMLTGALKCKIRNWEKVLYGEEQDRGPARPPVRDAGSVEGYRQAAG